MVSVYGYITVAQLEAFAAIDYGSRCNYTDAQVEAIISQSEREINTKVGSTFTGTIPDAIISLTIELSYRRMYNRMVWDGFMDRENPKKRLMPLWDDDTKGILKDYLDKIKDIAVDLIATYAGNSSGSQGLDFIP